jgi:predicted peptidase
MVAALKEAGGSPKYTEFKGVGHSSWGRTYDSSDTWDWLFKQKKNQ